MLTSLVNSDTVNGNGLFPLADELGLDGTIGEENPDHETVNECHAAADPKEG